MDPCHCYHSTSLMKFVMYQALNSKDIRQFIKIFKVLLAYRKILHFIIPSNTGRYLCCQFSGNLYIFCILL